jgi:hypothetical protein
MMLYVDNEKENKYKMRMKDEYISRGKTRYRDERSRRGYI